jgi:hypothetical protein
MTFKDPGIIFSFVAASNSSISAEICAFAFPRPEITVPCKEIVLSELIEPVPYALSIFLAVRMYRDYIQPIARALPKFPLPTLRMEGQYCSTNCHLHVTLMIHTAAQLSISAFAPRRLSKEFYDAKRLKHCFACILNIPCRATMLGGFWNCPPMRDNGSSAQKVFFHNLHNRHYRTLHRVRARIVSRSRLAGGTLHKGNRILRNPYGQLPS